jgi:hypothetical protein
MAQRRRARLHMQTAGDGALVEALRAGGGTADQRIERALRVLVEQLGLHVAYVSEFRGERSGVDLAVTGHVTDSGIDPVRMKLAGMPTAR